MNVLGRLGGRRRKDVPDDVPDVPDPEFEQLRDNFAWLVRDMEDVARGIEQFLVDAKQFYSTGQDLAEEFDSFYNGEYKRIWPEGFPNQLSDGRMASTFRTAWLFNNDILRRSVATTMLQDVLTPLKNIRQTVAPPAESQIGLRDTAKNDLDAALRLLNESQKRRDQIVRDGLHVGNAMDKKRKVEAQIALNAAKYQQAYDSFMVLNQQAKEAIAAAKITRDRIVEDATCRLVAMQAELTLQSAKQLEEVCALLPQDRVFETRNKVSELVRRGGPPHLEKESDNDSVMGKAKIVMRHGLGVESFAEREAREKRESQRKREHDLAKQKRQLQEIAKAANGGVLPERPGKLIQAGPHNAKPGQGTVAYSPKGFMNLGVQGRPNSRPSSPAAYPDPSSIPSYHSPGAGIGSSTGATSRTSSGPRTEYPAPAAHSLYPSPETVGFYGETSAAANGSSQQTWSPAKTPSLQSGMRSSGGVARDGRRAPPPPNRAPRGPAPAPPVQSKSWTGAERRPVPPPRPIGRSTAAGQWQRATSTPNVSEPEDIKDVPKGAVAAAMRSLPVRTGGSPLPASAVPQQETSSPTAADRPSRWNSAFTSGFSSPSAKRESNRSPRRGNERLNSPPNRRPPQPASSNGMAPSPPPPPPKQTGKAVRALARALYANVPDEADELAFQAGDLLEVLREEDENWWYGRVEGTRKEGVFPSNYVQLLK